MVDVTTVGVLTSNSAAANTSAINTALTNYKVLYFPAGTYQTNGAHALNSGHKVYGDGAGITILQIMTSSNHAFTITTGAFYVFLEDMTITRSSAGTGNGVHSSGYPNEVRLRNLYLDHHHNGLYLSSTDAGFVTNVVITASGSDGVYQTNVATAGTPPFPSQWEFENCIFGGSGRHGLFFEAQSVISNGFPPLGSYINASTFENAEIGMSFYATGNAVLAAVRISGGFFGADGTHAIYIDSAGGRDHVLTGGSIELCGGSGIALINSENATITGWMINGVHNSGIYSGANKVNISGCMITNSGAGGGSPVPYGIAIVGGKANVVGNSSGNTGGSTSQTYGIIATGGGTVNPSGSTNQQLVNYYFSNSTGPTSGV